MGDMADWINQGPDDYDYYLESNSVCVFIKYLLLVRETPKAYLLHLEDASEQWFPKSITKLLPEDGYARIPEWLADKRDLNCKLKLEKEADKLLRNAGRDDLCRRRRK